MQEQLLKVILKQMKEIQTIKQQLQLHQQYLPKQSKFFLLLAKHKLTPTDMRIQKVFLFHRKEQELQLAEVSYLFPML